MVQRQFVTSVKCMQTDGITEFKLMVKILEELSVLHRCTYHPIFSQNEVVESRYKRIFEKGLVLFSFTLRYPSNE